MLTAPLADSGLSWLLSKGCQARHFMAGVNVVIFGGLHDGFHALAQPDNLPNKNAQIARHHLVENIVLGSTLAPIS